MRVLSENLDVIAANPKARSHGVNRDHPVLRQEGLRHAIVSRLLQLQKRNEVGDRLYLLEIHNRSTTAGDKSGAIPDLPKPRLQELKGCYSALASQMPI